MAASINTNYGALVAAQALAATSRDLDKTQNRVTTGLKVASAKDNGAIWAIATNQKANAQALDATLNNLQRDQSIAEVALAAGDTIVAALTEMKTLAAAIVAGGAGASTVSYQRDYQALVTEISGAITGASFDGQAAFAHILTAMPAAITAPTDLTSAGGDWSGVTVAAVQTMVDNWTSALQEIGTESKSLERQITFNSKLQDSLVAGVGNLVDADLAKESAKLTALQTKQQLGVQALSIASQGSNILLSLFRN